ncbi:hypothetical protein [Vibrio europaeus]|uniref:hypothetical protein n=1 Tax=Vibrio europaeus TaxID=300876 RepID=UPI00148C4ABE|nr:hypothetical protein [Vibrio europaeus]NOH23865.1 hypothetical protein [Vibrio europaeus]
MTSLEYLTQIAEKNGYKVVDVTHKCSPVFVQKIGCKCVVELKLGVRNVMRLAVPERGQPTMMVVYSNPNMRNQKITSVWLDDFLGRFARYGASVHNVTSSQSDTEWLRQAARKHNRQSSRRKKEPAFDSKVWKIVNGKKVLRNTSASAEAKRRNSVKANKPDLTEKTFYVVRKNHW